MEDANIETRYITPYCCITPSWDGAFWWIERLQCGDNRNPSFYKVNKSTQIIDPKGFAIGLQVSLVHTKTCSSKEEAQLFCDISNLKIITKQQLIEIGHFEYLKLTDREFPSI